MVKSCTSSVQIVRSVWSNRALRQVFSCSRLVFSCTISKIYYVFFRINNLRKMVARVKRLFVLSNRAVGPEKQARTPLWMNFQNSLLTY